MAFMTIYCMNQWTNIADIHFFLKLSKLLLSNGPLFSFFFFFSFFLFKKLCGFKFIYIYHPEQYTDKEIQDLKLLTSP